MAIEKVRAYFEQFGIADRIKEFHESSATVELAAHALCTEPCRIAKTLSFMLGDKAILIVTAGDAKIDNHKYKSFFGAKAKMLKPEEVNDLIGHGIGGVCPFGINDGVTVYLDESLKRFKTVFPAAAAATAQSNSRFPNLKSTQTLSSGLTFARYNPLRPTIAVA